MFKSAYICCLIASLAVSTAVSEPAASPASDSAGHDFIYTQQAQFEVRGKENRFSLRANYDIRRIYLSERSTDRKLFRLWEPDYSHIDRVKVYFNGKKVSSKNVYSARPPARDAFLSDDRIFYLLAGTRISPGDSVRYSFRQTYDDASYMPLLEIDNEDYLAGYDVTFRHPKEMTVDFEVCYVRDSFPYTVERRSPELTVLHIGRLPYAGYLPLYGLNDLHGVILPILSYEGHPVNPASVKDFVDWYERHNPAELPYSGRIDSGLKARLEVLGTPWQRLAAVDDYVRRNINYLSDDRDTHGIFPHNPALVDSRRYGDCKDRAGLVMALARQAGISHVYMAAISTEAEPPLRRTHYSMYNHVICVHCVGDSTLFFDPTAKNYEFGSLPEWLVGRTALIFDPASPRRVVVRQTGSGPDLEMNITGDLDSLSAATARLTIRHDLLAFTRQEVDNYGANARCDSLQDELGWYFPSLPVRDLKVVDSSYDEMHIEGVADLSRFVVASPSRQYLPRAPIKIVSDEVLKRADDSLPVDYGYWYDIVLNLHLRAHGERFAADSAAFGDPGTGAFSTRLEPNDSGGVDVTYHLVRRLAILDGDAKAAHINFVRDYLKEQSKMYIVQREQP